MKAPPYQHVRIPFDVYHDKLLTPRAKLVYAALLYYKRADPYCFPSIKTISKFSHVSVREVSRALKRLAERQYIRKQESNLRRTTEYWFPHVEQDRDELKTCR